MLANVLMDADLKPAEISRMGIAAVKAEDLKRARAKGKALRFIARVAPELLDLDDPMARVSGTTNAICLQTDTMKKLALFEEQPGVEQTAYALLSDLLTIASDLSRSEEARL